MMVTRMTTTRPLGCTSNRNTCRLFSFLFGCILLLLPSTALAVDRHKFRTCQQTSFCRRHRTTTNNNNSNTKTTFKLLKDSVRLHIPDKLSQQQQQQQQQQQSEQDSKNTDMWKSIQRRLLGGVSSSGTSASQKDSIKDPYVRGPPPTLVGRILLQQKKKTKKKEGNNEEKEDEDEQHQQEELLEWSVSFLNNGVSRMRITEVYGPEEASGTAHERARVTYDDVVLTPENLHPAQHVLWIRGGDGKDNDGNATTTIIATSANEKKEPEEADNKNPINQQQQKLVLQKLVGSTDTSNFMAIQYGDNPMEDGSLSSGMILLVQLDPLVVSLYRSVDEPPIVVLGGQQLMHFEVRRFKDQSNNNKMNKNQKLQQQAADGKDEAAKPDKEIVGYWEDGLAIYADGTREERKEDNEDGEAAADKTTTAAEHRQLQEQQQEEEEEEEQDEGGLWEETFSSHVDSKPHGPMSVGMDITFPSSQHLYGIPEHASSAMLQTTTGEENSKYHEPYRLYNLDVFEYELDEVMALYGNIPLVVSQSLTTKTAGVFWFNPSETFVDVFDRNNSRVTHWISESGVMDVFLLPGPDPSTFYKQYAEITGYSALPPMFSLGYHQCRWNYKDERDVYFVHGKFEELDYPYDVLWLDIEHTDGKRYFTWDSALFPNPAEMQQKLAAQGRRMVTIIDPHIFRDDGYYIHKEATAKGLYIKKKDGKEDYDGWCWPGSSSYLDFTAEHVRAWWADQFQYSKYKGSTPTLFTWNDMNEPSVFNGPEVSMQKDLLNLRGDEHREWHNLYGMLFHRATTEGQIRRNTVDASTVSVPRPFVLSRAFFAGTQRYGPIWTGDNTAEWSHLVISTPMLLSLNSAALSFVGADVGGFFGNPDAQLFIRWMQAGAYQPFFRGHAHHDSKRREPWTFDNDTLAHLRKAAMERYALLPFWYTVFREAELTGMPVMRMMWMQYPDVADFFGIDDQYLIGSDLLVKPVTAEGADIASVMFPTDDIWYDVEFLSVIPTGKNSIPKSSVKLNVQAPIDKIPVFQRGGSIIPRKLRLRRSAMLMKTDPYTLYIALDKNRKAQGNLYMDDEETFGYRDKKEHATATFNADFSSAPNAVINNTVVVGEGWVEHVSSLMEDRMIERIVVMGVTSSPTSVHVSGGGAGDASFSAREFTYSSATSVLVVRKPEIPALAEWTMTIQF